MAVIFYTVSNFIVSVKSIETDLLNLSYETGFTLTYSSSSITGHFSQLHSCVDETLNSLRQH